MSIYLTYRIPLTNHTNFERSKIDTKLQCEEEVSLGKVIQFIYIVSTQFTFYGTLINSVIYIYLITTRHRKTILRRIGCLIKMQKTTHISAINKYIYIYTRSQQYLKYLKFGAVVVVIVWQLDLQLHLYMYLCKRCPSPLILLVRIPLMARCKTLCDKVCR